MTKSKLFNYTTLAACTFALTGAAACDNREPLEPNARVEAGLQRVMDEAVAGSEVLLPGAIAYYRDLQHASWSGGSGMGDLEAETPIRPKDQIRAGSIVKTFLATVTLQHVEEGTLSLEQPLPELLPRSVTDRVKNADEITLRMLLNHTSGIPEWVSPDVEAQAARDPSRVWSNDDALDIVAKLPAWFPPGTAWQYSNSDYTLIGMVLDRHGGSSWREQIRRRVIEPLGLESTRLPESGDLDITGDYAHGYQEVDGMPMDLSLIDSSMAGAAGGHAMITTVGDLAQFLDALLAGELFERKATLEAMTAMIEAPHESGLPHGYGLGLESFDFPGLPRVIGHAGGAGGYATMMFQVPDRDAILVTTINTSDLYTNALDVFAPSVEVIAADGNK